eukprot:843611-Pyramimonas_sp.AAC.1
MAKVTEAAQMTTMMTAANGDDNTDGDNFSDDDERWRRCDDYDDGGCDDAMLMVDCLTEWPDVWGRRPIRLRTAPLTK